MSSRCSKFGPLIGSIDEGTSSARFLVFAAETSELLTYHQIEILQMCPREGWVEQDPLQILKAVKDCMEITVNNLHKLEIDPMDIVAIGITNQRETVVVWDRYTGQPLYNAIVWLDVRTTSTVDDVLANVRDHNQDCLKSLCGLPVSTYFSAVKIRWLMDNVPEVRSAMEDKRCYFGTMDTWLLWNLTGGKYGGLYITDVTNASRTMLMNIKSLQWDSTLCKFFGIPMDLLPEIRSSSEIYGCMADGSLQGVPISGCLGDQQSALVGQMCFRQGQAKNTYGTGCFLLYNTGQSVSPKWKHFAPHIFFSLHGITKYVEKVHDMNHTFCLTEIQINIKMILRTKCRTVNHSFRNSDHMWVSVDGTAGCVVGHWLEYTHAEVMKGDDW